ncbi:TPA: CTP synthase, partial [Candidatus Bathyarchaeota archaeon]|nr:CTP synthase [Candidatus Bathyarchaeota archaeon]
KLNLPKSKGDWSQWRSVIHRFLNPKYEVKVALCGKYTELADSYVSVNEALKHSGAACNSRVKIDWIETEIFEEDPKKLETLLRYDGVLVPGGFGSRGAEGKIRAISFARVHDIPFLGICFGFQLAVVEFARHIGFKEANSAEIDPRTPHPVVDLMPEQRNLNYKGATMRLGAHEIVIKPGTLAHSLYKSTLIKERHRHRYEINLDYIPVLEENGLVFSGRSKDGRRMEILEMPSNRFHFATQFHAEFKSRPEKPSPPYYGFILHALKRKLEISKEGVESLASAL